MRRALGLAMAAAMLLAACSGEEAAAPSSTPEPATPEPVATPVPTPDPSVVTATEYGEDWPFTFDEGTLACDDVENGPAARIRAPDNIEYALNGVAIAFGFPELTMDSDVWRDDPSTGAKVSLGDLVGRALELCAGFSPPE